MLEVEDSHVSSVQLWLNKAHQLWIDKAHFQLLALAHGDYEPILEDPTVLYAIGTLLAALLVSKLISILTTPSEAPVKFPRPIPEAARPGWKGDVLESPSITDPSDPSNIICYDPATGYHLGTVRAHSEDDIRQRLEAAQAAWPEWRGTAWWQRRRVLKSLLAWITKDMEVIARVAARDTGKTAIDAAFGELLTTAEKLRWTIANAEKVLADDYRKGNLLLAHKRNYVVWEPVGVVGAVVSWNYPVHNALGPVIAALATGNAIVVKGSEVVAWSSAWIIDSVRSCLSACGHNPDIVQLVTCYPEAAEALTASPFLSHLTFIGSQPVGHKVALAAAKNLTPTVMELGGKDPAILLPSTDIGFFNSTFLRGVLQSMGQNCIGIERFIVHRSLMPELMGFIEPRMKTLQCGSWLDDTAFNPSRALDPNVNESDLRVDCGALLSSSQFDRLERLIDDAVKAGARLLVGGKRLIHPRWPKGHYFQPTLLVDVRPEMKIAQEELFAPVFLVMKYQTVDEAVRMANDCEYALGASVFGSRKGEARRVARRLKAGMVNINDFGVSYLSQGLPFGGAKGSGYGRFGGPEGLRGLCNAKAVTEDRFSLIRTMIPAPLDYPLSDAVRSWRFVRGLVLFVYGVHWTDRASGLRSLYRGL